MMDLTQGGLLLPNKDFRPVYDGRRSPLFHYDLDLSVARSVAAGTAVVVNVAGDSFFVDKNPSLVGPATVHFQDTTSGNAPAPVYCEPGFIAKVPYTRILIENDAQPGKIFRFHYGVDIDFTPGASSSVFINGNVAIIDNVSSVVQHYRRDVVPAAAFGTNAVFLPAANVSGAYIRSLYLAATCGAADVANGAFVAAPAAPADFLTGTQRIFLGFCRGNGGNNNTWEFNLARKIPAAWGLWFVWEGGGAGAGQMFGTIEYDFA